jgi:nitrate/nitrite transporter NarK
MSEFALVEAGTIRDDFPMEHTYVPMGSFPYSGSPPPIIGTIGTFYGDTGLGEGAYYTLKMSYVPEPSTALLGALGVLGALGLRRR